MEIGVLIAVIGVLSSPIAAFVTWFFNRRKSSADVFNTISESAQTSVETMQATMNTLHEELKVAQQKMIDMTDAMRGLELEILKLKATITEKDHDIVGLKERIYMLTAALQAHAVEKNEYI